MSYVLGLDLGTSSLKGLLVTQQGKVIQSVTADYPLSTPAAGYSEQAPGDWVKAAELVIEELIQLVPDIIEQLEGISFSGQMHSLVILDKDQHVLREAILWNDVRTTAQCQRIMTEMGDDVLALTKNIALEGFTLPKILWLQEYEPDIWEQVRYLMLPKDYLGFWLTDTIHMDYSDAAGTLMLDVEQKEWAWSIIDHFKIKRELLPTLIESTGQTGVMKPALQKCFGFKKEVKVFAGGADNACAAVGAGILSEGIAMSSIGTSGVFLAFEGNSSKSYQGELHLFNHAMPNATYSMGVTLAAGNSLSWFKDNFAENMSYDQLLTGIEEISPGSDGLLFTPYIVGERTPHVDSQIRGSFIGLDTHHTKKHLAKAVLEGITFSLKESQMLMEKVANKKFTKIVSVGGGAKNQAWLQMQADIFNSSVVNLAAEEGPGLGAAMLAAVGLGWFADIKGCAEKFVVYQDQYEPNVANAGKYQEFFEIYKDVYPATKDLNYRLQKLI